MNFYFDYFKDYCTKTEQFEEITVKIFGISPEGFPTKNQKKVLYRCSSEHCNCDDAHQCNLYKKFLFNKFY